MIAPDAASPIRDMVLMEKRDAIMRSSFLRPVEFHRGDLLRDGRRIGPRRAKRRAHPRRRRRWIGDDIVISQGRRRDPAPAFVEADQVVRRLQRRLFAPNPHTTGENVTDISVRIKDMAGDARFLCIKAMQLDDGVAFACAKVIDPTAARRAAGFSFNNLSGDVEQPGAGGARHPRRKNIVTHLPRFALPPRRLHHRPCPPPFQPEASLRHTVNKSLVCPFFR